MQVGNSKIILFSTDLAITTTVLPWLSNSSMLTIYASIKDGIGIFILQYPIRNINIIVNDNSAEGAVTLVQQKVNVYGSSADPIQLDNILAAVNKYKTANSALSYISSVAATLVHIGDYPFLNNPLPIELTCACMQPPMEFKRRSVKLL